MEAQEERLKILQKPESVISVQKALLDCQVSRRRTARRRGQALSPRPGRAVAASQGSPPNPHVFIVLCQADNYPRVFF